MQGERFKVNDLVQCISHDEMYTRREGCQIGEWYTVKGLYPDDRGYFRIDLTAQCWWLDPRDFRKEDPFLTRFKEIIADEETT